MLRIKISKGAEGAGSYFCNELAKEEYFFKERKTTEEAKDLLEFPKGTGGKENSGKS